MQNKSCDKRTRVLVRAGRNALGAIALLAVILPMRAAAQMNTTTVQGTIYRANGTAASGTLLINWPAFSTPQNQAVAAGSLSAAIGANGFVSINLTPNAGALPTGSYYTVVYHLNDGTVNREYWVIPASGTASIASVRAMLQPSTVAVQPSVTSAYVQSAISALSSTYLPLEGGTLTGALTLSGDPAAANQAATKHYADQLAASVLPLGGGALTGPMTAPQLSGVYTVDGTVYASVASALQACLASTSAACTIDARGSGRAGNAAGAAADVIGSFDPERCTTSSSGTNCTPVPLTLELGPFNDYTVGTITLEAGMKLIGTATNGAGTPGTVITCNSSANPCLVLPQNNGENVTDGLIQGVTFAGAAGNTSQDGADLELTALSNAQYGDSVWQDVTFLGFMGDSIHLAGSPTAGTGSSTIQYIKFIGVTAVRQPGAGYTLYVAGSVGNNQFFGGRFDTAWGLWCDTTGPNGGADIYIGANGSGTFNPYSLLFEGTTIEGGSVLIHFNGAERILLHGVHHEGCGGYNSTTAVTIAGGGGTGATAAATTAGGYVTGLSVTGGGSGFVAAPTVTISGLGQGATATATVSGGMITGLTVTSGGVGPITNGYLFTLGGSQNKAITVDGAYFAGNIGTASSTDPQPGYIFNTHNSGTALTLNVVDSAWGSPTNVVLGNPGNSSQALRFSHNFPPMNGTPGLSSGVVPSLVAAATLSVQSFSTADISGKAPVCTLTGYQMPGETVTLRATAAGVTLQTAAAGCASSNLNLDTLPTLTLNSGETASFQYNDSTSTWDLVGLGKSANRELAGTTTLSDTGSSGDSQFQNFVSSSYGNCWVSRKYAGTPGLWSPSMTCTNGSPAKLSFYGSPQAAEGSESWSLLASLQSGLASLPGNLSVTGSANVQGAVSGASINGEITVDGTVYPTLNAAWGAAASLAAVSGQNQTIRLGPGTFPVNATLAEPGNGGCVSLLGSAGTTMNADSPQIATTLTVPALLSGDVFFLGNAAQAQGCTFRDLNLMTARNATHGFEMQWFRGLLIDNVTVNDTSAEGILLGEENTASGHQASFLLRTVTVSYSSAAFTPANRPAWGIHLQQTAMDSHLDNIVVRNALTAAIDNEGTGNTGYLIHGFGYPYTCATGPCSNTASSGSASNASYATNYVVYDTGGAGSVWTDTYADSPAVAGFYIGANGIAIHGGHIQWPDLTSFPGANLAYVAAGVSNNLLIADVDCLEMNSGVNWITYAGTAGNPPTYASVHHLTGCGNYYQALEPAEVSGFSSGGANINDPSGAVPRVWSTPIAAASSYPAYSAQLYTGYLGDAFQAHFSGITPFFNVTYQGTIRTNGGIALGTIVNTASSLTLTAANKNVIANASGGPQTITLPSCYTPLADNASPAGLEFTIVKSDTSSNAVTLQTTSSQMIYNQGNAAPTLVLSAPSTQTLVCGPDYNWYIAGSAGGAGSSGGVTSFNGRTAAVSPAASDYSFSQLSGQATNAQLPATLTAPTSGNAATATALAAAPTQCATGYYATGVTAGGTANCLQSWHFTWYGNFSGTFGTATNTSLGAIWSPTAAIKMTRLDIAVGTAPAGCTTYPVIGIYDGTSSSWLKTVTLAPATYSYRNTASVAITAGHNLSMGVQTAGVGCTTNPGTAQLTMEYTMNQ
ncbi:MAG TPA: hypothetical protein VHX60_16900 [Acidobacteriaceae bacterium]|jgi:hypothetical protein|nr:hypothetical protein [Acidobacteriaceae bacterium]